MDGDPRSGSQSKDIQLTLVERARAALRAARDGDKSAFDHVFDQGFDAIYALCWRLTGDRIQAEKLTENVLVCATEALLAPELSYDPVLIGHDYAEQLAEPDR